MQCQVGHDATHGRHDGLENLGVHPCESRRQEEPATQEDGGGLRQASSDRVGKALPPRACCIVHRQRHCHTLRHIVQCDGNRHAEAHLGGLQRGEEDSDAFRKVVKRNAHSRDEAAEHHPSPDRLLILLFNILLPLLPSTCTVSVGRRLSHSRRDSLPAGQAALCRAFASQIYHTARRLPSVPACRWHNHGFPAWQAEVGLWY
mmetsp:Transcript_29365/g.82808  ORF Transcript_29365/g.82808 Transcript_29365/m.82808 type:complete len:203 (+) Transcript_29365:477-1085(+)